LYWTECDDDVVLIDGEPNYSIEGREDEREEKGEEEREDAGNYCRYDGGVRSAHRPL
jgi:hypothetical protein